MKLSTRRSRYLLPIEVPDVVLFSTGVVEDGAAAGLVDIRHAVRADALFAEQVIQLARRQRRPGNRRAGRPADPPVGGIEGCYDTAARTRTTMPGWANQFRLRQLRRHNSRQIINLEDILRVGFYTNVERINRIRGTLGCGKEVMTRSERCSGGVGRADAASGTIRWPSSQNQSSQGVNAILDLLRTGCQWRLLPREFPVWGTA